MILPLSVQTAHGSGAFTFSHTKAKSCGQDWVFLEELLEKNKARCREVLEIEGFPYLRGTRQVLEMAKGLDSKYSQHQWLELLRRIDLDVRYRELSMLPEKELEKFCKRAGIGCFQGRIRSYVARCSAIIMGDEKRNHGYMKTLREKALEALKTPSEGGAICFDNGVNLDGLLSQDVFDRVARPPKSSVRKSSSYLEQRIQRSKQAGRP